MARHPPVWCQLRSHIVSYERVEGYQRNPSTYLPTGDYGEADCLYGQGNGVNGQAQTFSIRLIGSFWWPCTDEAANYYGSVSKGIT